MKSPRHSFQLATCADVLFSTDIAPLSTISLLQVALRACKQLPVHVRYCSLLALLQTINGGSATGPTSSSGDSGCGVAAYAVNCVELPNVLSKQAVALLDDLMPIIISDRRAAASLMRALCSHSNTGGSSNSSWLKAEGLLLLVSMIGHSGQSLTNGEWQQASALVSEAAYSPPHAAQHADEEYGLHRLKSSATLDKSSSDRSSSSNRSSTANPARASKASSRRMVAATKVKEVQSEQLIQATEGASHAAAVAPCPAMLAVRVWCLQQLATASIPGV